MQITELLNELERAESLCILGRQASEDSDNRDVKRLAVQFDVILERIESAISEVSK